MNTYDYETYDNPDGTTTAGSEIRIQEQMSGQLAVPDRVTNKVVKGLDHPSFFAKGCVDETPGGQYLTPEVTADNDTIPSDGVASQWRAARLDENGLFIEPEPVEDEEDENPEENVNVVVSTANADEGEFIPALSGGFEGPKKGFIFRRGSKGVGYYVDLSSLKNLAIDKIIENIVQE
jgi:hypothetical protein